MKNISIITLLAFSCALLAYSRMATGAAYPPAEPTPLATQILATFKPTTPPKPSESTLLANGAGYVRELPNGTIIQLKGISQVSNMGCGFSAYANACILQQAADAQQLTHDLNDLDSAQAFGIDLENTLLKQGKSPKIIQQLKDVCGLVFEEIAGDKPIFNNFIIGNEGLRKSFRDEKILYKLFPSKNDIKSWQAYKAAISPTFSPAFSSFANPQIPRQLPCICIVNIGTTGGHYIAVRLERLPDNKFAIIFVDSVQFSEGEFIDKIDAYMQYFTQWLDEMPRYFRPASPKTTPAVKVIAQPIQRPLPTIPPVKRTPSIFGELGPILLNDVVEAVISGKSADIVNRSLADLQRESKIFAEVAPLVLTSDKEANYDARMLLIIALSSIAPAAKKEIAAQLKTLLSNTNVSGDERKLAQELATALSD